MKRKFLVEVEIDEDPEMLFSQSKICEAIELYVDQLENSSYREYEIQVKVKEITASNYLVRTMPRSSDEPHQYSTNNDIPERYQR